MFRTEGRTDLLREAIGPHGSRVGPARECLRTPIATCDFPDGTPFIPLDPPVLKICNVL